VYDYHGNAGFITLGTSRETSACVCDAIALAWQEDRAEHYPHAQQILLTFDAGAANAARSLRFKEDLSVRGTSPLWRVASYLISKQIETHLTKPYLGCQPGPTTQTIKKLIWETIFTLNINDALDRAYEKMLLECKQMYLLITRASSNY